MLRDLIAAQEFEMTPVPPLDAARERELIARARAQGLLPDSAAGLVRRRFAGLRTAWAAAGYERLGRPGIDADLPQPPPIEVQQILEKHHIPVPKDGTLVVEFDEPGDR